MGVGDKRHAPAAVNTGREAILTVKDAGCAPGSVWTGAENLAPPEFDPQIVQPVASRYTD